MDPLTDSSEFTPDGVQIIRPGALTRGSKNWRLTEEAYRRYEHCIRTAIQNWPNETAFEIPDGVSPNTFEHRLRDALQAIKLYPYDPDVQSALATIRTELVVSMDPDGKKIWIRAKGTRGRPVQIHKAESHQRLTQASIGLVLPPATEAAILAFLQLSASGHRTEPVTFKGRVDPQLKQLILTTYDTAFVYDEVRDVTTML